MAGDVAQGLAQRRREAVAQVLIARHGNDEFALAFGLRLWAMNLWATLGLMVLTALAFPLTYWGLGLLQESDRRLISLLVQRVRGKSPAST